jgi:hypothetical protein
MDEFRFLAGVILDKFDLSLHVIQAIFHALQQGFQFFDRIQCCFAIGRHIVLFTFLVVVTVTHVARIDDTVATTRVAPLGLMMHTANAKSEMSIDTSIQSTQS